MNVLINIDVNDLARATEFYTGAFGWRVGRRFGEDGVELLGATAPVYLLAKGTGTPPFPGAAGRAYTRHWTPVHLDVVVEDLKPALERALAHGARLEHPPREAAWGRIAVLSDPFGHGFCLIQFLGRGYDEIATR